MRTTCIVLGLLSAALTGCALTHWTPYDEFVPPSGQGPVVLLISGSSGPKNYVFLAEDLAARGYYVVLTDGHAFPPNEAAGGENLQRMIREAQNSPHAVPGKVGIVGLSLGGETVLAYANSLPTLVSVAVAYYPKTSSFRNKENLVANWGVPTLVFAGDKDNAPEQGGCCMIDDIQTISDLAKERAAPFQLVVYPGAQHAFNLPLVGKFDRYATEDAWQRTLSTLQQHLRS